MDPTRTRPFLITGAVCGGQAPAQSGVCPTPEVVGNPAAPVNFFFKKQTKKGPPLSMPSMRNRYPASRWFPHYSRRGAQLG